MAQDYVLVALWGTWLEVEHVTLELGGVNSSPMLGIKLA